MITETNKYTYIPDYAERNLPDAQMQAMEQWMLEDKEFKDAVLLHIALRARHNAKRKQELQKLLKPSILTTLYRRTSQPLRWAAMLVAILGFSIFFVVTNNDVDTLQNWADRDLVYTANTFLGTPDTIDWRKLMDRGYLKAAQSFLHDLLAADNAPQNKDEIYYALAQTYLFEQPYDYSKAILLLQKIDSKQFYDYDMVLWYTALTYVKLEEWQKAKTIFEQLKEIATPVRKAEADKYLQKIDDIL